MKPTIGSYLKTLSVSDRIELEELRRFVHSIYSFEECIVYGMPGFRYKGKVAACFRMYARHIGFYPYSGSIIKKFSKELQKYKTNAGAVQFPKGGKLPKVIIRTIIKARMKDIDDEQKD